MIDPRTVDELRWHDELVAGLSEEGHDRACEVILTGLHTPQAVRTRGIVAQGILAYLAAVEPGALSAASSNPSGAVPLEPQEEKLSLSDAAAIADELSDRLRVDVPHGMVENTMRTVRKQRGRAVPLLQDEPDDV